MPIEMAQEGDVYKDFRVLSYEPTAPAEGRIRSVSLLYASFASFGVLDRGMEIVEAMRARFGMFATGWGFKLRPEGPTWELYWYNEQEEPRSKAVPHLAEALEPFGGLHLTVDPAIPYASFSMDLDEIIDGSDGVSWLNLYFGNGVDYRCPGFSYLTTADDMVLQNAYFVADTAVDMEVTQLRQRMLFSARNGASEAIDGLLGTAPDPCKYLYFVHKPRCDSFYYSQTDLAFYRHFVRWASFPTDFCDFVDEHADQLDHLRWDTGLNYLVTDGAIEVTKVGCYGYF